MSISLSLVGYTLDVEVFESQHSVVFRGLRELDRRPVIVKILKEDYPPIEEVVKYRREVEIARTLGGTPGVVEVLGLEKVGNRLAIVLEDFGGRSLREWLAERSFSVEEVLGIGIQVADCLDRLHALRVIHKDVNPNNILLAPDGRSVKLIDFGIATLLPSESPGFERPERLEGTLPYIAPEQTGQAVHALDYRADLYSFGATLYQLCTGQLPFLSTDPEELVRAHLLRKPLPPAEVNPEVPRVLSDIILKLMAKAPDLRYQSARGIRCDLEHCRDLLKTSGRIEAFPIGAHDLAERLSIPDKLFGRKREVAALVEGFERVRQGQSELLIVCGYSGVGKTALVKRFFQPFTQLHGIFIQGKFNILQRSRPYSAFIDAFQQLVRQLLTEDPARLVAVCARLKEALGHNAKVILDILPQLALVIGSQPDVIELQSIPRENRFNRMILKFISAFGQPEAPLVMFIDDWQWADGASLRLLKLIMTSPESQSLYLIGAYRENEVGPGHPLLAVLKEIEQERGPNARICLTPLGVGDVAELLSETLRQEVSSLDGLSALLHQKTGGNPLFLREYLRSLADEGLLWLDRETGAWRWDLDQIQSRGVTDDVAELLTEKIRKLPEQSQNLLKVCACLGSHLDLEPLTWALGGTPQRIVQTLHPLVADGYLVPLDVSYRLIEHDDSATLDRYQLSYKFVHDRIQQVAYALLSAEEQQNIHARIGRLYLKKYPPAKEDRHLFDTVNHLNLVQHSAFRAEERLELARLNLLAGKKAKVSSAYDPALKYLLVGRNLLAPDGWSAEESLMRSLTEEGAEAALLSTDLTRMWELTAEVLEHCQDPLLQLKVYNLRILGHIAQNDPRLATREALAYLKRLGISLPERPGRLRALLALLSIKVALSPGTVRRLLSLPRMTDPGRAAAMQILITVGTSLFQSNPTLLVLLNRARLSMILKHGNSVWSGSTFSGSAILLAGVLSDLKTAYAMGQVALQVTEQFDAVGQRCRTNFLNCTFAVHCQDPVRSTLGPLLDGYQIGLETGDFEFAAFSLHVFCQHGYLIGLPLEQFERDIRAHTEAIQRLKQKKLWNYNRGFHRAVINLCSPAAKPNLFNGSLVDEEEAIAEFLRIGDGSGLMGVYFLKLHLCCIFKRWEVAEGFAEEARRWLPAVRGNFMFTRFFFYDSLCAIQGQTLGIRTSLRKTLARVAGNQRVLRKRAAQAPQNHQHAFLLVEAEKSRLLGQHGKAVELYLEAIAAAREHDYPNDEGLGCELAAAHFRFLGRHDLANKMLRDARYAYLRWGATAKVAEMDRGEEG